MNWRPVVMVSVGLNVLLGTLVFKNRGLPSRSEVTKGGAMVRFYTNYVTRSLTNLIDDPVVPASTEVIWPKWSELAGGSWSEYRDNLLSYGCPPATLRNVLVAGLKREHFDERQRLAAPVSHRFWDLVALHASDDNIPEFEILEEEFDNLSNKYDQLENELLQGIPDGTQRPRRGSIPQYSHLSAETQTQLGTLEVENERAAGAIARDKKFRDDQNRLTLEGRRALNELAEKTSARQRELMSEEEFEEYRLRSTGAANWAADLGGFTLSEEEYRQVAKWKVALGDQYPENPRLARNAEENRIAALASEQELSARMRGLFGDARYAAYERSRQADYGMLSDLGDVFDLPETTVNQAWEMKRAAEETAANVRVDTSMTVEEKRAALRAVQQETVDSFQKLLGADILHAYEHKSGGLRAGLQLVPN